MHKLFTLSILLSLSFFVHAQLYTISNDVVFKDGAGNTLDAALVGGLNQPIFSSMDLNGDGKLDLVVYDRTGEKILTFVNRSGSTGFDYVYEPKYEEYFPKGREFVMLRDYNNDNKPDLYTYDGDSVVLYQNYTAGTVDFRKKMGLFALDSVSYVKFNPFARFNQVVGCLPGIEDLDSDGDMDYVTNLNSTGSAMILYDNLSVDSNFALEEIRYVIPDKCYGGIDEFNGKLIVNAPCLFREAYRSKKKHAATKTMLYIDMDQDGDFDLLYGSSERLTNPVYYFKNGRESVTNQYKDTFISMDTAFFSPSVERLIPVAPAMSYLDLDNDGVKDLILSTNESDKRAYPILETNNVLYFLNSGANDKPVFNYQSNDLLVGDMLDLGGYAAPRFVDIDDDGDQDLFVATNNDHFVSGDTVDVLYFYENIGDNLQPQMQLRDTDYLNLSARKIQHMAPEFADINGDGLYDLFYGKLDGSITYFKNTGTKASASFSHVTDAFANAWAFYDAAPKFYDFDKNGTLDLLMGHKHGPIKYYKNTGTTTTPSFQWVTDTLGKVLINELVVTSILGPNGFYDTLVHLTEGGSMLDIVSFNDTTEYLCVGGYEGKVRLFEMGTHHDSVFKEAENYMYHEDRNEYYVKDYGRGTAPAAADLNNDGISDIIIGNYRGGLTYLKGRDTTNGIRNYQRRAFGVYPNPSEGSLSLHLLVNGNHTYRLLDITGVEVASGILPVNRVLHFGSDLANGVYFVELSSNSVDYAPQKVILMR